MSARRLVSNSSGRAKPNKSAHSVECHCIGKHAIKQCSSSFPINSSPRFAAGPSVGNIVVPSFHLLNVRQFFPLTSIIVWLPWCLKRRASCHQPVLLSGIFDTHLGSLGRFFAIQAFCRRPRIFTHPRKAGYKNKGRAIRQSGRTATRKRQGPGYRAPNVLGWETARVFQEEGMRDYRYRNMGGNLYSVYVDLLLFSPI